MGNYDIARKVVDHCAKEDLLSSDLVDLISSAKNISSCLNRELGAYGIVTSVSPDQKAVYIDNEGMSQILNFFEGKSAQLNSVADSLNVNPLHASVELLVNKLFVKPVPDDAEKARAARTRKLVPNLTELCCWPVLKFIHHAL